MHHPHAHHRTCTCTICTHIMHHAARTCTNLIPLASMPISLPIASPSPAHLPPLNSYHHSRAALSRTLSRLLAVLLFFFPAVSFFLSFFEPSPFLFLLPRSFHCNPCKTPNISHVSTSRFSVLPETFLRRHLLADLTRRRPQAACTAILAGAAIATIPKGFEFKRRAARSYFSAASVSTSAGGCCLSACAANHRAAKSEPTCACHLTPRK